MPDTLSHEAPHRPELPQSLSKEDIKPHPIAVGETELVFQRHGAYERADIEGVGSLTAQSRIDETAASQAYFENFIAELPEDERDSVDILVVASDTRYHGGGQRSYETAEIAQNSAAQVLDKAKIAATNIINLSHELKGEDGPRTMRHLREPQMIDNSPDFMKLLTDKYGDMTLPFWIAFEEDAEKDARIKMGAEGPDDIADRLHRSADILARYAKIYHNKHPGRRLVIWAATHYDTISPFVKRDIFGVGKDQPLEVAYGGGIAIDIDHAGDAKTTIAGVEYPVPLAK